MNINFKKTIEILKTLRKGGASERDRFDLSNPYNPEKFLPRNHMFNVTTEEIQNNTAQYPALTPGWVNLDFMTNYPTSVVGANNNNDYPDGFNVAFYHNPTLTGESGVYVAPKANRVLYISRFMIVAEVANSSDISRPLDINGQALELSHSGQVFCRAESLSNLLTKAFIARKEQSVYTPSLWTYYIVIESKPAGDFDGNISKYFQIKMSNNTAPENDFMTHMYFAFEMWETHTDME